MYLSLALACFNWRPQLPVPTSSHCVTALLNTGPALSRTFGKFACHRNGVCKCMRLNLREAVLYRIQTPFRPGMSARCVVLSRFEQRLKPPCACLARPCHTRCAINTSKGIRCRKQIREPRCVSSHYLLHVHVYCTCVEQLQFSIYSCQSALCLLHLQRKRHCASRLSSNCRRCSMHRGCIRPTCSKVASLWHDFARIWFRHTSCTLLVLISWL